MLQEVDAEGGQPYSAVAMSLVFHSATPFVPTLRADVRLFEVRFDPVGRADFLHDAGHKHYSSLATYC